MIHPADFFELGDLESIFPTLFEGVEQVWELLNRIEPFLAGIFPRQAAILGQVEVGAILLNPESIYIGRGTHVEAGAYIKGPVYLGDNCEVRHGAYLRGQVIAGDGCVLGHASEFKNALLLPGSGAPHFAYVGDSILGRRVNLGAGTRLSNLGIPSDRAKTAAGRRPTIKISLPGRSEPVDTGLAKLGAILGDDVKTGCNAVLNPGCLVGPGTLIYSNVSLPKGYWAGGKIIKLRQQLEEVALRGED
jgi:NDP-sugar pyrophosphorylase family protein